MTLLKSSFRQKCFLSSENFAMITRRSAVSYFVVKIVFDSLSFNVDAFFANALAMEMIIF